MKTEKQKNADDRTVSQTNDVCEAGPRAGGRCHVAGVLATCLRTWVVLAVCVVAAPAVGASARDGDAKYWEG